MVTRLDEPVRRRYLAGLDPPAPGESEMPDDEAEALPAALDLGGVMLEALALALPPYPRAPGAEPGAETGAKTGAKTRAGPGAEPPTDEALRPFAGLRDALKRDG